MSDGIYVLVKKYYLRLSGIVSKVGAYLFLSGMHAFVGVCFLLLFLDFLNT